MKHTDDFHLSLKDYLEAHRLSDKQREIMLGTVTAARAIVDEKGEKQISARAYSDYMFFTLDDLSKAARRLQSLDDLKAYECLARDFLHEWAIIIGNISYLIAQGQGRHSIDDSAQTLERFIGAMADILEHLVYANKLFIAFARARGASPTGNQS